MPETTVKGEINVVFKLGTDPNVDAVNVQNRVSAATNKTTCCRGARRSEDFA
jgi:hypothetical protein